MLVEVLEILAQKAGEYADETVTLGNVAYLDDSNASSLDDKIVVSLINLSEENTMKNWPNYRTVGTSKLLKQPIINLNLYVMFCANFGSSKYDREILALGKVIEFFQGKKVFTQSNTVYDHTYSAMNTLRDLDNFKIHVELYTPTFEEQSYIWGSLGGKQRPAAIYKVSVVQLESESVQSQSGIITETNQNLNQL